MKIVFLLDAGIPSYRNFLFEHISQHPAVSDSIVLHTGRIYDGKKGGYIDKKVKFVGSSRLGCHIGVFKYLWKADIIISAYNIRMISCWLPVTLFHKKLIYWGKGLGEVKSPIVLTLRKFTAKYCRKILVYNEQKKAELIDATKVTGDKVIAYQNTVFIENPIDFKFEEKEHFLYFGRLQRRKGLIELIEAYREYVTRVGNPKFKLRIVGDGEEKSALISKTKTMKIEEWVEFFPGVYDEEDIARHFKSAAFYVSPYNVGLGVINSFASGVPVLTCKEPQVGPEFHYLNRENSIIVETMDEFSQAFYEIENTDLPAKFNAYNTYKNGLHHSIMLKNFVDTILTVANE